jgi:hypothetical protein
MIILKKAGARSGRVARMTRGCEDPPLNGSSPLWRIHFKNENREPEDKSRMRITVVSAFSTLN